MSENTNVIVLSGLAICLVIVIDVAVTINPITGAALGPLLLGVATIIRAIRGKNTDEDVAGTDATKPKTPLPVDDNLAIDRNPVGSTITEPALPDSAQ